MNIELLQIFAGIPTCTYEETITKKTVTGIILAADVAYLYLIYRLLRKYNLTVRPTTASGKLMKSLGFVGIFLGLLAVGVVLSLFALLAFTPLCS